MNIPKKKTISTASYFLNPQMRVLDEKEKKALLEKYNVKDKDLPRILMADPAAVELKAKVGDVVEIKRKDPSGEYLSYRIASE